MKNELEHLVPRELVALAGACRRLVLILNARVFTFLTMMLCAGAFAWVLYDPNWIRFGAACAFAVLVFWPAYRLENAKREREDHGETSV